MLLRLPRFRGSAALPVQPLRRGCGRDSVARAGLLSGSPICAAAVAIRKQQRGEPGESFPALGDPQPRVAQREPSIALKRWTNANRQSSAGARSPLILLTVYGSEPWQSEALLGYALMMFHQSSVLTRNDVEAALNARSGSNYPYSGYPLNNSLGLCGLNDQSELLKITPEA